MRFKRKRFPRLNEIVICTVKKITPYAAFCDLDEFEGKEGMLHVTEISSRVVRRVKEVLSEGQKIIAKVIRVNPSKGFIDLSIKRVPEFEKKRKRKEIRKEKKAHKILELFCLKRGLDPDDFFEKYFREYYEDGYIFEIFERAVEDGKDFLKKFLPNDLIDDFFSIIEKEFGKPVREIRFIFNVISFHPDGVIRIREFFSEVKKRFGKISDESEFLYQGSPKYLVILKTREPKKLERELEKELLKIKKLAKEKELEFSFEREKI